MASQPPKKLVRLLALPGYTQNAFIMRKKTGAVRKACKGVEFVYLEPPHVLDKVDFANGTASLKDFDSEATVDGEQTPETTPRAWFTSTNVTLGDSVTKKYTYNMMNETIAYLHDYLLKEEPFDGVLGFSQGGCMAALLAALLERPSLHPSFPSNPKLKPFKFAIFCGGFAAADESFAHFYPLELPTLHVLGRGDTIVTEERSMTLVRQCEDARVEYHDGGHFIPSKANWKHFLADYMTSFKQGGLEGDVPPPSATSGLSQPSTAAPTREGSPVEETPRL